MYKCSHGARSGLQLPLNLESLGTLTRKLAYLQILNVVPTPDFWKQYCAFCTCTCTCTCTKGISHTLDGLHYLGAARSWEDRPHATLDRHGFPMFFWRIDAGVIGARTSLAVCVYIQKSIPVSQGVLLFRCVVSKRQIEYYLVSFENFSSRSSITTIELLTTSHILGVGS